ncbi:MAG: threonylcarbamoyl-AMP synthase, partial [Clostridiales bacterium]|nr:threonylcarbamoyl-AMP synthase [Clostridiales bacterium]
MNAVETIFLKIDLNLDKSPIRQASKIIKSGGLVAFPTETVYGLGAVMRNEQAVRNIYKAKGRPEDNPLILHIYKESQIFELTENLSAYAKQLIDAFCPGPLTLVAEKSALVPAWGTAGLDTVAIRMPGNPVALTLLEYVDEPVFAPSANTSGRPSPTRAEHVLKDLNKKIDCVLDGGSAVLGLESTVVDVTGKIPRILRPGYVTAKDIKSVVGAVELADNSDDKPKSPGTKYKHYAPNAEMRIVVGEPAAAAEEIIRLSRRLPRRLP